MKLHGNYLGQSLKATQGLTLFLALTDSCLSKIWKCKSKKILPPMIIASSSLKVSRNFLQFMYNWLNKTIRYNWLAKSNQVKSKWPKYQVEWVSKDTDITILPIFVDSSWMYAPLHWLCKWKEEELLVMFTLLRGNLQMQVVWDRGFSLLFSESLPPL